MYENIHTLGATFSNIYNKIQSFPVFTQKTHENIKTFKTFILRLPWQWQLYMCIRCKAKIRNLKLQTNQ